MKPTFRAGALILFGLFISRPVDAQKAYAIAIGGGAAIPVGRLSETQKTGYNATAGVVIGAADLPFGLRVDGIFNRLPRHTTGGQAPANGAFRVSGATANLVFAFPGTTAKPYLMAGVGFYSTKDLDSTTKAQNDWGFNGGVGAAFGLGPVSAFVESRYHSVSRSVADGGVIHFVPVTIGLLL